MSDRKAMSDDECDAVDDSDFHLPKLSDYYTRMANTTNTSDYNRYLSYHLTRQVIAVDDKDPIADNQHHQYSGRVWVDYTSVPSVPSVPSSLTKDEASPLLETYSRPQSASTRSTISLTADDIDADDSINYSVTQQSTDAVPTNLFNLHVICLMFDLLVLIVFGTIMVTNVDPSGLLDITMWTLLYSMAYCIILAIIVKLIKRNTRGAITFIFWLFATLIFMLVAAPIIVTVSISDIDVHTAGLYCLMMSGGLLFVTTVATCPNWIIERMTTVRIITPINIV
jgi:hypothetical protein